LPVSRSINLTLSKTTGGEGRERGSNERGGGGERDEERREEEVGLPGTITSSNIKGMMAQTAQMNALTRYPNYNRRYTISVAIRRGCEGAPDNRWAWG
jgi:hypothetical protein